MILKTYTRIFTTDLEATVATLKAVHGTEPHFRLEFAPWTLVGIGDVLAVAALRQHHHAERDLVDHPEGARFLVRRIRKNN